MNAMCLIKTRYASKKDAQTACNARLNGRKGYRHNRPTDLRLYPCPICHGWHLTKQLKEPLK